VWLEFRIHPDCHDSIMVPILKALPRSFMTFCDNLGVDFLYSCRVKYRDLKLNLTTQFELICHLGNPLPSLLLVYPFALPT
jgi:hypothetical protein